MRRTALRLLRRAPRLSPDADADRRLPRPPAAGADRRERAGRVLSGVDRGQRPGRALRQRMHAAGAAHRARQGGGRLCSEHRVCAAAADRRAVDSAARRRPSCPRLDAHAHPVALGPRERVQPRRERRLVAAQDLHPRHG
jgi:hypothetical protein